MVHGGTYATRTNGLWTVQVDWTAPESVDRYLRNGRHSFNNRFVDFTDIGLDYTSPPRWPTIALDQVYSHSYRPEVHQAVGSATQLLYVQASGQSRDRDTCRLISRQPTSTEPKNGSFRYRMPKLEYGTEPRNCSSTTPGNAKGDGQSNTERYRLLEQQNPSGLQLQGSNLVGPTSSTRPSRWTSGTLLQRHSISRTGLQRSYRLFKDHEYERYLNEVQQQNRPRHEQPRRVR